MSRRIIPLRLRDRLALMIVGDELNKSELMNEFYDKPDYFSRRSFDVHLHKAKKELISRFPERTYVSNRDGLIRRIS